MGPSLVMMKETVKVAMVARSKVLGNVLRYGTQRAPERIATST